MQGKLKELDGDPAELEGLENVQQEELLNAFKKYKLLTEGDSMATAKLRMEDIVKVPQLPCLPQYVSFTTHTALPSCWSGSIG